jgi:hypothetical protein
MSAPRPFEVRLRCGAFALDQSVIAESSMDAMLVALQIAVDVHADQVALQVDELSIVVKPLKLARPRISCEAAGVCQASTACMNHHACMAEALGLPLNSSTGLPT